jgi:hypothetical protein
MPAEASKATATAYAAVPALAGRHHIGNLKEGRTKARRIWSKFGKIDIGVDDNFFDAGGQSLLLLRMPVSSSTFGVRLQIVKLLVPTSNAIR